MSFAVIKRVIDEEPTAALVDRDLKVASAKELDAALARIHRELAIRQNPDHLLVTVHLNHIAGELATSPLDFSLEHLELYLQYLHRLIPGVLSEEHCTVPTHVLPVARPPSARPPSPAHRPYRPVSACSLMCTHASRATR